MPTPSRRTRSKKRLHTKLSGGERAVHYRKKKTNIPRCSNCCQTLAGLPHQEPNNLSKLPANQKKVERMYGGYLCHNCLCDSLREAARKL